MKTIENQNENVRIYVDEYWKRLVDRIFHLI